MLTPWDWILLAVIVVGLAVRAAFGVRMLRRLGPEEAARMRPRLWARAILTQWGLVGALGVLWLARGRGFDWLGLAPRANMALGGVLLGALAAGVALRSQRAAVRERPELLERVRRRFADVEAIMPHAEAEWPGFVSLAVTAGICEEILFRGFVIWHLAHVLPSWWLAAGLQALLFGLAHAYQGPRGILVTGLVGVFFTAIVAFTGSLWAAMLLHAMVDLHSGRLALAVFERAGTPAGADA